MRMPRPRPSVVPVLVATAVLSVAGCGDGDDGEALSSVGGPTSPGLEVVATEMAYDPDAVAVEAGQVPVTLQNGGTILHDLRVEDQPFILEAVAGETVTGQLELEAGSYAFFCSLPGHREAGMEGVLEVR
jgi:uncharacterized cupredoxin-like copper-binding protein